ncbi:DHHW family protein [Paludicola sp. MB14-C6]|uniref:DHHW family protein n=1 Tax=Paludihabitans sp. MB14-C6 TaxID=3070656 RepID=UPI0027DD38F6|nr:DHHW family protein [Paludicola sp. MB14-C6]WMJ21986.1 DHHW family protein [Paludicola sp. MB14-C6]
MSHKKVAVVAFFIILIMIPMVTFLLPKKSFSETENRKLADAPQFSVRNFLDKSFMNEAESFMSDHLVFRNQFSSYKTKMELLQGRKEVNGVFISNKMLLEKVDEVKPTITNGNIDAINKFAAKHKGKINTSIMLVPTAAEFYPNNISRNASVLDQTKYIQNFYTKLKNINCIDAYAPLSAAAENYIFYKTDHHWTTFGAYVGYSAMSKALSFKPATVDMFNIEYVPDDFLGTLYSKVLYGEKLADRMELYHYVKGEVVTDVVKYTNHNKQTYPSILFRNNLEKKDKYSVFLGSNEPIVKIKSKVQNGQKLIMFKDSYSHALMQFLPLHYEEIVLVDTRYLNKPLEEYVNINDYQQAVFLYNISGFVKDSSVKKVANY